MTRVGRFVLVVFVAIVLGFLIAILTATAYHLIARSVGWHDTGELESVTFRIYIWTFAISSISIALIATLFGNRELGSPIREIAFATLAGFVLSFVAAFFASTFFHQWPTSPKAPMTLFLSVLGIGTPCCSMLLAYRLLHSDGREILDEKTSTATRDKSPA